MTVITCIVLQTKGSMVEIEEDQDVTSLIKIELVHTASV